MLPGRRLSLPPLRLELGDPGLRAPSRITVGLGLGLGCRLNRCNLGQQLVPLGVKELAPLTPLLDLPIAAESKPTLREELEKALAGVPASASHACLAPDPTAIPPMSMP